MTTRPQTNPPLHAYAPSQLSPSSAPSTYLRSFVKPQPSESETLTQRGGYRKASDVGHHTRRMLPLPPAVAASSGGGNGCIDMGVGVGGDGGGSIGGDVAKGTFAANIGGGGVGCGSKGGGRDGVPKLERKQSVTPTHANDEPILALQARQPLLMVDCEYPRHQPTHAHTHATTSSTVGLEAMGGFDIVDGECTMSSHELGTFKNLELILFKILAQYG